MRILIQFSLIVVIMTFVSCGTKKKKVAVDIPPTLAAVSPETEAIIKKAFPGAMIAPEFSDSVLRFLNRKYGIVSNQLLLGASTCVDDIIYTKNFHVHTEIKGPFHLGGLAGLPFTGISGLEAFAHHIPDDGTMLLLVEPHIGYSEKHGWGYVLRHEQHEASTCCGALMGTLEKLKSGKLSSAITEDDYQSDKIAALALDHKKEILADDNPIIALTKLTSLSAEKQIRAHVLDVQMTHVKYIIIITGVIINTDYNFLDYQFIDHIMIYDVNKKLFIEDLKNSGIQR